MESTVVKCDRCDALIESGRRKLVLKGGGGGDNQAEFDLCGAANNNCAAAVIDFINAGLSQP